MDWFIQVCTAHPPAVGFRIIGLENPSELKSKFQNILLSFTSAAWLHIPCEKFCLPKCFLKPLFSKYSYESKCLRSSSSDKSYWPCDVEVGFQLHLIHVNNKLAHQNESELLNHQRSPNSEGANNLETENGCSFILLNSDRRLVQCSLPCCKKAACCMARVTTSWSEITMITDV